MLDEGGLGREQLPANLRARGAKPHWLGDLATPELDPTIAAFVARGATRLGNRELFRDRGGAILALTSARDRSRRDVVWQQLFTADPERAKRDYGELFVVTLGATL